MCTILVEDCAAAAAGENITWLWWNVTSAGNSTGQSCGLFCSPRQESAFKVLECKLIDFSFTKKETD